MKPPRLFRWRKGPSPSGEFVTVGADGIPDVWLHEGQDKARRSSARFILVLAGAQSGKTALGPPWLLEEMQRKGPGNYILVAPTFRLLEKQAAPSLVRFLGTILKLGSQVGNEFRLSEAGHGRIWPHLPHQPTRIIFGYAENPDSLESLTAKAAWLDEAGQKGFKSASWEAIQSRLAINQGRALFTSTPYEHGWLKKEVYDRAERNRQAVAKNLPPNPADAGFDSVSYESRMNPTFSQEEWERQKLVLPPWKFNIRYRGVFTRPIGAVFDCWDSGEMVCPAFVIPEHWDRLTGTDFGYPNHSTVFLAEETHLIEQEGQSPRYHKTGRYHVYREYRPQESRQANEHVRYMQYGETRLPEFAVGGSMSEQAWRDQFASHGYPISEPDQREVEVGIDRIYQLIAEGRLVVHDSCPKLISELETFSRVVGENGDVLDELDDEPSFHGIASLRYIASFILRTGPAVDVFF